MRVFGPNVSQELEMLNLSHEDSPLLETDHPDLNLECFDLEIDNERNNRGDARSLNLTKEKSNTPLSYKLIVSSNLDYGFVDIDNDVDTFFYDISLWLTGCGPKDKIGDTFGLEIHVQHECFETALIPEVANPDDNFIELELIATFS